jgi:hypothetical protein
MTRSQPGPLSDGPGWAPGGLFSGVWGGVSGHCMMFSFAIARVPSIRPAVKMR